MPLICMQYVKQQLENIFAIRSNSSDDPDDDDDDDLSSDEDRLVSLQKPWGPRRTFKHVHQNLRQLPTSHPNQHKTPSRIVPV